MTRTRLNDVEAARRFEELDPADAVVRDRAAVADIEAGVRARGDVEKSILDAVRRARHEGVTWTEIGLALGVSHQAAIKRYRDRI